MNRGENWLRNATVKEQGAALGWQRSSRDRERDTEKARRWAGSVDVGGEQLIKGCLEGCSASEKVITELLARLDIVLGIRRVQKVLRITEQRVWRVKLPLPPPKLWADGRR